MENINFSITQYGKELSESKYSWNEETKTLSTTESNLVLDFTNFNGVTFITGSSCIFDTYEGCVFKTGSKCNFKTGYNCTFDTGSCCTFKTDDNYVIVRRNVFEVIQIPKNTKIKLNDYQVKGYTVIEEKHKLMLDDKEIEISNESYLEMKKLFKGE